jgi:hypothetical protein
MRTAYSKTMYFSLAAGAVAFLGLLFYLEKIESKDIGAGMLAMLGTLLGATLAFRLNEEKESLKREGERRAALNRSLFVLVRQVNAVALIAKELEPFKSDFERAFNLPAAKVPLYADLVHDFQSLEFLIETSEANTLMRLTVEQERFQQTLESLKTRNQFYVDEVQPQIAKHSLNKKDVSDQSVVSLFGERIHGAAMTAAAVLKFHVDASAKSLPEMHEELRAVAKRLYPDHKFIAYKT